MPAQLANRLGEITAGGAEAVGPTNPSDESGFAGLFLLRRSAAAGLGGLAAGGAVRGGLALRLGLAAGCGRRLSRRVRLGGERTETKKGGQSPPPSDGFGGLMPTAPPAELHASLRASASH